MSAAEKALTNLHTMADYSALAMLTDGSNRLNGTLQTVEGVSCPSGYQLESGGIVSKIFESRAEFVNKTVEIIGDEMPAQQYAEIMSRFLGRKITYGHICREAYASMGFSNARELGDKDGAERPSH